MPCKEVSRDLWVIDDGRTESIMDPNTIVTSGVRLVNVRQIGLLGGAITRDCVNICGGVIAPRGTATMKDSFVLFELDT